MKITIVFNIDEPTLWDKNESIEFFGYCFAPFLCLTLATTFVVWHVKDNP